MNARRDPDPHLHATEHFNLQTERASATSEVNGRLQLYMSTLSASLITLALAERIRHYYTEIAPEMAPYFLMPTNDDPLYILAGSGISDRGRPEASP